MNDVVAVLPILEQAGYRTNEFKIGIALAPVIEVSFSKMEEIEEEALEVQRVWISGDREKAAQLVPSELILQTNFLGSTAQVTERVRSYRDAGVTVLRVQPEGADNQERLDSLGGIVDIVRTINQEQSNM